MLEWNVWVSDVNAKTIKPHNVFHHFRFLDDLKKAERKYKGDRDAFLREVEHLCHYYYWSKCEWEIVLSHWPPREGYAEEKVDVWDQIALNWDRFADYLWENRKELTKRER